eukprot:CAMPEP_0174306798 /NCGR_PEP_ID=MMETSP0810-20121108/692_1 /TAXON_ID=73025 ORGANISM="Eutreptiella gymnastica-like, Strain CCMP1594" /NCGR_SAMPLE_ID=MMETSP0810 /ASSEMBLY_ACC=CAM_ASM_000659 /LENGTH=91 /DNA_ID=CAMNT_0015413635 /DNA_START=352 /DNA_END=627 /DNA_ORIENTATION=+
MKIGQSFNNTRPNDMRNEDLPMPWGLLCYHERYHSEQQNTFLGLLKTGAVLRVQRDLPLQPWLRLSGAVMKMEYLPRNSCGQRFDTLQTFV